jgi:hypothetical protein
MSKRKRASLGKTTPGSEHNPATEETSDEAKADMVHVTPDLLSGGPDIFSSRGKEEAAPIEPEAGEPPATVSEPIEPEAPIKGPAAPAEREESEVAAAATPEAIPAPVHEAAAITPEPARIAPPSRAAQFMRRTPRGAGTSAALGIVLVVLGLFALLVAVSGLDLTQYGWPLFVIVPGLTLLVVGFVGVGPGASIPGGIVTTLGLLLAYQNATGDWASWAYAWALVAPGGIGLGMYLPGEPQDRTLADVHRPADLHDRIRFLRIDHGHQRQGLWHVRQSRAAGAADSDRHHPGPEKHPEKPERLEAASRASAERRDRPGTRPPLCGV